MPLKSKTTTNHNEIKLWAEKRGGKPVKIRNIRSRNTGLLRINFPGFADEIEYEYIEWDEFFRIFEDHKLAFFYQEKTRDGDESRFNKFISRE